MLPPTVAALVIDLDGVIRRSDRGATAAVEAEFGLPAGAIGRSAHAPQLRRSVVTGAITDATWRRRVQADLAGLVGEQTAVAAVAEWTAQRGAVDTAVMGLVRRVAFCTPVVLFTNATSRLDGDLAAAGLTGEFAAVVSSARTGVSIPSSAAFAAAEQAVARVAEHRAEPIVYVDDNPSHVTAARRRGWTARTFSGATDLRRLLDAHGLIIYGCLPDGPDRQIERWETTAPVDR